METTEQVAERFVKESAVNRSTRDFLNDDTLKAAVISLLRQREAQVWQEAAKLARDAGFSENVASHHGGPIRTGFEMAVAIEMWCLDRSLR
jgi:hypothetical protein